ncbi:OLC1v1038819C1 [Oldenlandia corymbosa var. corymbosa]|uniref:OLC1v1038819C1 n=1 Tax=Oldenlandia corymbosa var. corymbosa TaxID=529605 RepID=A0AAV1D0R9_OLDCO|nr:OLC1v1038819C1 [Oldenlandia corymbosa var. corymbosa]
MELPNQEGEMPIPLNSTYGGHGHMIHHHDPPPAIVVSAAAHNNNHILTPSTTNGPISATIEDHGNNNNHVPFKKMIRYRECLKNHAASMGGNATDGCGEFMPSGEEGSLEALTCSACNCHRNFHRKEIEGEPSSCDCFLSPHLNRVGRKVIVGHHHKSLLGPETFGYPTGGALIHSRAAPPHHPMIMSYNMGSLPSESDEQDEAGGGGGGGGGGGVVNRPPHINNHHHHHHQLMKKRFRTKFTQEQKEKMLNFAEKVGWKIQKQEEGVVQQFCQEVGVKRRVLKVWMHNNKHNLAKKNINNNNNNSVSSNIISPQNHQV